jgi:nitrite reductase (NADH) large subunit
VESVEFNGGEIVDADLVVIAAGIRPNADLGRKAGLTVNRGIVVDDYMVTSDPDILAVGECTEHRGQCFGLVAPLYDQGRVLAAAITGTPGDPFVAAAPAAKLKIMGVDIFSSGTFDDTEPGIEVVKYEDPALGVYKKLLIKENKLQGMILVGDVEDEHTYSDWMRNGTDLTEMRRQILFPPRDADPGLEVADMPRRSQG